MRVENHAGNRCATQRQARPLTHESKCARSQQDHEHRLAQEIPAAKHDECDLRAGLEVPEDDGDEERREVPEPCSYPRAHLQAHLHTAHRSRQHDEEDRDHQCRCDLRRGAPAPEEEFHLAIVEGGSDEPVRKWQQEGVYRWGMLVPRGVKVASGPLAVQPTSRRRYACGAL